MKLRVFVLFFVMFKSLSGVDVVQEMSYVIEENGDKRLANGTVIPFHIRKVDKCNLLL